MPIWQLCTNLLIPNCLRSNLSYSPLAALELYVTKPITLDEAHILIKLFPPTALYGIEWTLLHLIESVYPETEFIKYKELINECNSVEFREMLVQRLNNSQQNKVTNK